MAGAQAVRGRRGLAPGEPAVDDSASLRSRIERLEAAQAMLLEVGRLSVTAHDLDAFLAAVHAAVGRILYAANFFVALYDASDSTLRFPYFVDEADPPEDPARRFPIRGPEESPTARVVLTGERLVATAADFAGRYEESAAWRTGTDAAHWLGEPLHASDGRVIGAVVIQSYQPGRIYSDEDIALFGQIADHISTALEKLTATQRLEQAIAERTRELEREVAERRQAEKLQAGLYEIAAMSATDAPLDELYRKVHEVTAGLLYARNFFIMLYHEAEQEASFPYLVDEHGDEDPLGARYALWRGPTAFVVRSRQPQLIDPPRRAQLVEAGEIVESRGHLATSSWIGAPMIVGERVYGAMVAQSYDPAVRHDEADLDLLAYMATHVAGALSRREADTRLREAHARIHRRNEKLTRTLDELREAQEELIRHEKLASLGGLVAGGAHEINTPLGICVTASSHIQAELKRWRRWYEAGEMDKAKFEAMLAELDTALRILDKNTRRGAELVQSFKQIAVDQSSGQRRPFDLAEYLDEILLSLRPRLKQFAGKVEVECPTNLRLDSYPGAISQVVTNLVMNALLHAFDGRAPGTVWIKAGVDGDDVLLSVADDGVGMSRPDLNRYFDPFFTTKRGQGGTGLGANIVFNLVSGALGGSIQVASEPGAGLKVQMRIPRELREAADASATGQVEPPTD
jgi:signal transduction histidine kinase